MTRKPLIMQSCTLMDRASPCVSKRHIMKGGEMWSRRSTEDHTILELEASTIKQTTDRPKVSLEHYTAHDYEYMARETAFRMTPEDSIEWYRLNS